MKTKFSKLQQFLDQESFEPAFSWGVRMALSLALPIIWGTQTGNAQEAEWMALTAEAICWVPLKGTVGQRLRVVAGGVFLAFFFATFGALIGFSTILSVLGMLIVAFIASLFKNLGDRGSGLSLCVYLMFIISNAHPVVGQDLLYRTQWILLGGAWYAILAIASFIFIPVQQPYRRTIALIWKANATLIQSIGVGWDGKKVRSSQRNIYLNEKAVRSAIDHSFHFYERMAHQVNEGKNEQEYQLAQVRKAAALTATAMSAINEEMEAIKLSSIDQELRLKMAEVFKSLQYTSERLSIFILTKRAEEELLLRSRITKLTTDISLLKNHRQSQSIIIAKPLARIIMLVERILKFIESSTEQLHDMSETSVFKSYSLIKTVLILHPKHWLRNLRLLFNINTHTMRYVLRTSIIAAIGVAIWKIFDIDRGYWITFTIMIVSQPYFGATFQKAIDRTIGTVLGGIAGGLFLLLPAGLHMKEIMLFVSAISMMYFFKSRYSVASFFITLNLVLLFSVSAELNRHLLWVRALSTIFGAGLSVIAGFLLFPAWDRKWLPRHLAATIHMNYDYFIATFFQESKDATYSWTKSKRQAETANSNAFDSFNRYIQELGAARATISSYYQFITHSVRLTRELNNINLEQDGKDAESAARNATTDQIMLVYECLDLFNELLTMVPTLYRKEDVKVFTDKTAITTFHLNAPQVVYLEKIIAELKAERKNIIDVIKNNQLVAEHK